MEIFITQQSKIFIKYDNCSFANKSVSAYRYRIVSLGLPDLGKGAALYNIRHGINIFTRSYNWINFYYPFLECCSHMLKYNTEKLLKTVNDHLSSGGRSILTPGS